MPGDLKTYVVQISAKLLDAHECAKKIFGDGFERQMKTFRPFVQAEMQGKKCSVLAAVTNIVSDLQKNCPGSGMSQVLILAAGVEILESEESGKSG